MISKPFTLFARCVGVYVYMYSTLYARFSVNSNKRGCTFIIERSFRMVKTVFHYTVRARDFNIVKRNFDAVETQLYIVLSYITHGWMCSTMLIIFVLP